MTTTLSPRSGARRRRAIDTTIGRVVIEGDDGALVGLFLPGSVPPPGPATDGPRRRGNDTGGAVGAADADDATSDVMAQARRELEEYFAGERTDFTVPLRFTRGTAFQQQVWRALAAIPHGTTISYAELADRVGRPNAFRAVGQANGANPIPIVLPCHRVLASGGAIGGYGGGLAMKRALLGLEGVHPA
jgi:methylated-DNA-[protein]-cysteine S-methyltransferase